MKKLITLFAIAGMVLALAPAAQAQEIIDPSGFTATARYESTGSAAAAVNGSGIVSGAGAEGIHVGNNSNTAWLDNTWADPEYEFSTTWFRVNLGATYAVGKMYVWNGQPTVWDRGSGYADIYYSTDETTTDAIPTGGASSGDWILITAAQALNPKANSTADYGPTDALDLSVTAQAIGLYLTQDDGAAHPSGLWGPGTGGNGGNSLSELQFFGAAPPAGTVLIIR
jgi:hypothetical protein